MNNGSTLIEVLVVAVIMATSLVALASLTTMSTARNRLAKERSVATRLAQEGMDWVMSERNRVGISGMNLDQTTYCLNGFPEGGVDGLEVDCDFSLLDLYQRELGVDLIDDDGTIHYHVTVSWGEDKEVKLSGAITKWLRQN